MTDVAAAGTSAPARWDDEGDPFGLAPPAVPPAAPRRPVPRRRRMSPLGWAGAGLAGSFVVVAAAAPWLMPFDPRALGLASESLSPPSGRHLLGTNQIGNDLLSQVIAGARASVVIALLAGVTTVALGAAVGIAAGWFGGAVETALMRVSDVMLATPQLPLLFVVGLWAGRGLVSISLVMALLFWPGTARVVRAQVRSLRTSTHVRAAVGFGAGTLYALRRHVVPEIGLILMTRVVGASSRAVLFEAGLAYLGVGDSGRLSWGSILRDARQSSGLYYTRIWTWWVLPPVLALVLFLLGLTFLSVGLEGRVNPRLARHTGGRR